MLLIVNVQPLYITSDLQNFSQDSFWLGSFLWITAMATPPRTTAGHDRDDRHFDPERPRLHEREDASMTVDDLDLQLTTSRQLSTTRWRTRRRLLDKDDLVLQLATFDSSPRWLEDGWNVDFEHDRNYSAWLRPSLLTILVDSYSVLFSVFFWTLSSNHLSR